MSFNLQNIDLILQFSVLTAGEIDDKYDRQLGPIHLIKYVYLADLIHARLREGETFSEANWIFYKFGPWSQAVNSRIEPALKAIHAEKSQFESDYEDKEDWVRWEKRDEYLLESIQKKLPPLLTSQLKKIILKYGKDTSELLNYVYLTNPMLNAAPNEKLDFLTELRSNYNYKAEASEVSAKKLSKNKEKKLHDNISALKNKFQSGRTKKPKLIQPKQPPIDIYDDIYEQGIQWLDSLAGEPIASKDIEVEFDDSIWKSPTRSKNDLS